MLLRSAILGGTATALGLLAVVSLAQKPVAWAAGARICAAPRTGAATPEGGFGTVHFANSCTAAVQPALEQEIARLHNFEAGAGGFTAIAARDPGCAMAWWGAAMAQRGNPLGGTLEAAHLKAGRQFADRARGIPTVSPREKRLVAAMDIYYRPYPTQIARARAYAEKMDALHAAYPDDPDIAALDGLAIIEGVDLDDKTYARQKRAGAILEALMKAHPDHPGAPHYLIHAYDYTALADRAVPAAEIYPKIATASSHAQHMPSHIWSMLGHWDRSIDANRKADAIIDPTSAGKEVEGDIVFEHAFDFIAYARLQKGQDRHVAEDFAASKRQPLIVAARYPLERGDWVGASRLDAGAVGSFEWSLLHFTRAYGAARAGNIALAESELRDLRELRGDVAANAGEYWGVFVDIYVKTAEAWLRKAKGDTTAALALMREAAAQDDGHEKHIYLENKILPMRESLADMEMAMGQPRAALADYEATLKLAPNRYRSFLGAAQAAATLGDKAAARRWWSRLLDLARDGDHARPGYAVAKSYLAAGG